MLYRCALLLVLLLLSLPVKAEEDCRSAYDHLGSELNREAIVKNKFITNRPLEGNPPGGSYSSLLGSDFLPAVERLGATDQWLDVGSGKATFAKAALQKIKARLTALTVTEPERSHTEAKEFAEFQEEHHKKFRYLTGRYIEQYSPEEIGPVKLITDVYGAMSYAEHPDQVLQKYGELLVPGGELHLALEDFSLHEGVNGSTIPALEWYKKIRGFEIVKYELDAPTQIILRRNGEPLFVPTLTKRRFYSNGTGLPTRDYDLAD